MLDLGETFRNEVHAIEDTGDFVLQLIIIVHRRTSALVHGNVDGGGGGRCR